MPTGHNQPLYELWDKAARLPPPGFVPDLRVMTHVTVARAVAGEFQFMHEVLDHGTRRSTCGRMGQRSAR